jgi:hypothetical protein
LLQHAAAQQAPSLVALGQLGKLAGGKLRQVREQPAQLRLRAGRIGGSQPLIELVVIQAPCAVVRRQGGGSLVAFLVGRPQVGRVGWHHDRRIVACPRRRNPRGAATPGGAANQPVVRELVRRLGAARSDGFR